MYLQKVLKFSPTEYKITSRSHKIWTLKNEFWTFLKAC